VDGKPVEGLRGARTQVPLAEIYEKPEHLENAGRVDAQLQTVGVFDEKGHLKAELAEHCEKGKCARA